jgi:hypothetical protein
VVLGVSVRVYWQEQETRMQLYGMNVIQGNEELMKVNFFLNDNTIKK